MKFYDFCSHDTIIHLVLSLSFKPITCSADFPYAKNAHALFQNYVKPI